LPLPKTMNKNYSILIRNTFFKKKNRDKNTTMVAVALQDLQKHPPPHTQTDEIKNIFIIL